MRYLQLISCFFLFSGCTLLYSDLQKTAGDQNCLQKFAPAFTTLLFHAGIEVTGKHLSGLLLIKKMPDSGTRLVFTSETGLGFFDFGFSKTGVFKVYQIIRPMDKKPVIKTLRKDFELVFMLGPPSQNGYILKADSGLYYAFPRQKGIYYYITDNSCSRLLKMQRASKRKVIVEAFIQNDLKGLPDSIGISHKNFNFDMGLKRILR
jgi:hypothetical protein